MGLLTKKHNTKLSSFNTVNWTLVNNQWLSPKDNGFTYIDEGYKKLPNLYALIRWMINKSAIVPFQIVEEKSAASAQKYDAMTKMFNPNTNMYKFMKLKEEAFEVKEGTDLEKLLNNPNHTMTGIEFNEAIDGYNLLTGNAFAYGVTPGVGANARKPMELHVIPSPCVTPIANRDLQIEKYKVSYYDDFIDSELIGHTKYFNPLSSMDSPAESLLGMSPLMSCRSLIGKYKSADIAQGAMFTNMGPAGILSGENNEMTETQARGVQDRFVQFHQGEHKANKITVVPSRMHWTQIGLSPVDLNIIQGKKEILSELCNVYGLPIDLFSSESSKYDNAGQARKIAITDAIIPIVEKRKEMLNKWLAPKFGDKLRIEYDYTVFDEMQEDLNEKVEALQKIWQLTPNQILGELGFEENPDPNMNKVYIPQSYIPLADTSLELPEVEETDEVLQDANNE